MLIEEWQTGRSYTIGVRGDLDALISTPGASGITSINKAYVELILHLRGSRYFDYLTVPQMSIERPVIVIGSFGEGEHYDGIARVDHIVRTGLGPHIGSRFMSV